jgi:hypothetical protein
VADDRGREGERQGRTARLLAALIRNRSAVSVTAAHTVGGRQRHTPGTI